MEGGAGIGIFAELGRGRELLRQLEAHLYQPSGIEHCKSLAPMILSSIDRAMYMSISKSNHFEAEGLLVAADSGGGSPRSEGSSQPFKGQERRGMPKKRKTLPRCTTQVRAGSGEGMDSPLDDGYNWRKYGQKVILRAKYPRAYYRCTHQKTRDCPAIKQVQRSDENPSIYEVTYRGTHTCRQTPQPVLSMQENEQSKLDDDVHQQMLLALGTDLKVKTDGQGLVESTSESFSFPSTPVSCLSPDSSIFSSPPVPEKCFSHLFVSPDTSESNYFSLSPCRMRRHGEELSLQAGESEFAENFSAVTSAATSPMMDVDFMLDQLELDQDFSSFLLQD